MRLLHRTSRTVHIYMASDNPRYRRRYNRLHYYKKEKRQQDINPDYCCFVIPNVFVIGYGLDYNEQYRNLPYVGVLKEEIYNK